MLAFGVLCYVHVGLTLNVEIGEVPAKHLLKLEPDNVRICPAIKYKCKCKEMGWSQQGMSHHEDTQG